MKKLLLLTLMFPIFLQAEDDLIQSLIDTLGKNDICKVYFGNLYKNGYGDCKENDILLSSRMGKNEHLLAICKVGTFQPLGESQVTCILRAEKTIGKIKER